MFREWRKAKVVQLSSGYMSTRPVPLRMVGQLAYQFPKPRKSPRHLPSYRRRQRSNYQSDSGTLLNFCGSIPELISPSLLELLKALILMFKRWLGELEENQARSAQKISSTSDQFYKTQL